MVQTIQTGTSYYLQTVPSVTMGKTGDTSTYILCHLLLWETLGIDLINQIGTACTFTYTLCHQLLWETPATDLIMQTCSHAHLHRDCAVSYNLGNKVGHILFRFYYHVNLCPV